MPKLALRYLVHFRHIPIYHWIQGNKKWAGSSPVRNCTEKFKTLPLLPFCSFGGTQSFMHYQYNIEIVSKEGTVSCSSWLPPGPTWTVHAICHTAVTSTHWAHWNPKLRIIFPHIYLTLSEMNSTPFCNYSFSSPRANTTIRWQRRLSSVVQPQG